MIEKNQPPETAPPPLQDPRGDTGPQGPTGRRGPTGPQGPSGPPGGGISRAEFWAIMGIVVAIVITALNIYYTNLSREIDGIVGDLGEIRGDIKQVDNRQREFGNRLAVLDDNVKSIKLTLPKELNRLHGAFDKKIEDLNQALSDKLDAIMESIPGSDSPPR